MICQFTAKANSVAGYVDQVDYTSDLNNGIEQTGIRDAPGSGRVTQNITCQYIVLLHIMGDFHSLKCVKFTCVRSVLCDTIMWQCDMTISCLQCLLSSTIFPQGCHYHTDPLLLPALENYTLQLCLGLYLTHNITQSYVSRGWWMTHPSAQKLQAQQFCNTISKT